MVSLRYFPLLPLLVLLACGAEPRPVRDFGSIDAAGRFIVSEPTEIIREETYSHDLTTAVWPNQEWHAVGSTRISGTDERGLTFSGPKGPWTLEADLNVDASSVTWLLVEFSERPQGHVQVEWSRAGEAFAKERSLSMGRADGISFKSPVFKFPVGSHPLWDGRITAIRLRCQGSPDRPMTLVRASGGIRALRPEPEEILERPWKVDLGRDLRNGLAALPGKIRLLQADVGEHDQFLVAVGLERTATEPVKFSVLVDTGAARHETAIERILDPRKGEIDQWFDLRVELSRYEGKAVTFSLVSDVSDLAQMEKGIAWWAGPRLVNSRAATDHPNIVVFCIDTLRADRMSLYGNPRPTTPELERWIEKTGVVFETVIASAPWTLPSHVSMFSGISALHHGVNHAVTVSPGLAVWERPQAIPLMAEVLRGYGYRTGAFTGGAYLHPRWGLARGFDTYNYWSDRARSHDELTTNLERFRRWAVGQGKPWFAFVHTYEVHDPYEPREEFYDQLAAGVPRLNGIVALEGVSGTREGGFRSRMRWILRERNGPTRPLGDGEMRTALPALYDSHVAFADAQIGAVLNRWDALGLPPNTIIVVTSDHGQVFGETVDAGHTSLHETTIGVPLLLALPNAPGAGRRISGQARLVDLLPTLLDGAGLEVPPSIDGVSLVPVVLGGGEVAPRPVTSVAAKANVGVSLRAANGLKLLFNDTAWSGAKPRIEAFDLAEDPLERHPLPVGSGEVPDMIRRLTEKIRSEAPGLVMIVRAEETADLEIDLRGLLVQQRGLRTMPDHPADLIWRGANHATLRLAAGENTEVRFEKIFGETLSIGGTAPGSVGEPGFEHVVSVVSVRDHGPLFLSLERGFFSDRDAETHSPSSPGIFLSWQGPQTAGTSMNEIDPDLSDQLRALGYVE